MVPEPRFSNGVSGLLVPRSRSAPGCGVSNGGGRGYGVRRTGEVAPSDVQNWVSHAVRSPEKACDVLEASRGSICTNDGAWRRVARSRERPCLAVQAYCRNLPHASGDTLSS
jgi:hypothetical protein